MYQRILVPIDGSDTAQRAFEAALELAREYGSELIPLYVVDLPMATFEAPGFDPSIVRNSLMQEGERLSAEALTAMQRENVKGAPRLAETNVLGDDIAQCILRTAQETQADLVVMGTHGRRGVKRLVLGSVAESFVRMACCPVMLIPRSAEPGEPAKAS